MTTKNIVIAIISIIVIAGAWYGISSRDNADTNTPQENEKTSAVIDENKIVFNGEGRKVVGPVKLGKGLVILKAKNQSGVNSVFSVNVYSDTNNNGTFESDEEYSGFTGSNISVGYENAEAFDGAIAVKSGDGAYFTSVEGGRWQLTFVKSEKLKEPAPAPVSFSGKGIQVTEKFYLSAGEYSFNAINKGTGNFIINMIDEEGNSTKRLVNEIDNFEGDFIVNNVFDGNYIFAIRGGDWTITKNK